MARWNCVSQIGEIEGITEVREQLDTSIVPTTELDQKTDTSAWDFGFQPLTEEEKKAFVDLWTLTVSGYCESWPAKIASRIQKNLQQRQRQRQLQGK